MLGVEGIGHELLRIDVRIARTRQRLPDPGLSGIAIARR
jgi:hypothetical protein